MVKIHLNTTAVKSLKKTKTFSISYKPVVFFVLSIPGGMTSDSSVNIFVFATLNMSRYIKANLNQ